MDTKRAAFGDAMLILSTESLRKWLCFNKIQASPGFWHRRCFIDCRKVKTNGAYSAP